MNYISSIMSDLLPVRGPAIGQPKAVVRVGRHTLFGWEEIMSAITRLIPRQRVPNLSLPLAGGGSWRLSDQKPKHFTLVVFYRGLHCPVCRQYLAELQSSLADFKELGVSVIAISSDSDQRARQTDVEWSLTQLPIAYGLPIEQALAWGLYISKGRGKTSLGIEEPPLFVEPGLFLIKPDLTLYYASVQTMPFVRPSLSGVLAAIEFAVAKQYPPRGDFVGS
jgi:peroxiredoxin